jgi:hypothetical protein
MPAIFSRKPGEFTLAADPTADRPRKAFARLRRARPRNWFELIGRAEADR